MSGDGSLKGINTPYTSRSVQYGLMILQAITLGMISFSVVTLIADMVDRVPAVRYDSVITASTKVAPGHFVDVHVQYTKMRDCSGTAIITLYYDDLSESYTIVTEPIGGRPPGTFQLKRSYRIPFNAKEGKAHIVETLAYQCPSGPSIVRSPPVAIIISKD